MDCSLPGSSVHGIFQARVLEWGAIAFSKTLPKKRKKEEIKKRDTERMINTQLTCFVCHISGIHGTDCPCLVTKLCLTLETSWTVSHHTPLSIGFSRQEYWSGLPFPSPGDLLDPGIEPGSPALQADALTSKSPGKPHGTG